MRQKPSRRSWSWLICAALLGCPAAAQGQFTPGADGQGRSPAEQFANERLWLVDFQEPIPAAAAAESYEAIPYADPAPPWPGGAYDAGGELCPECDECPRHGLYAFFGYDSWKGISDSGWANNGLHTGVNYGTRLGRFSDWTGFGFQFGGSVGVYNFNGTDYHVARQDQATMQGFVTGGFFRKPTENSPCCFGLVQDWMVTSNYGIFAENPTLGQWRGQLGYALGPWYEIGIWAAWRGQGDTRQVSGFGEVAWRPVEQFNFYTRYKWGEDGVDTWLWIGLPEEDRLNGDNSLGDYTVGALANVPLSDRLMLYALVAYMHPSSAPGPAGSREESWCFAVGLSIYPGRNAKSRTVGDQCWMPLMPVANNGTFLADASQTF
jgi:hypothetical protein